MIWMPCRSIMISAVKILEMDRGRLSLISRSYYYFAREEVLKIILMQKKFRFSLGGNRDFFIYLQPQTKTS